VVAGDEDRSREANQGPMHGVELPPTFRRLSTVGMRDKRRPRSATRSSRFGIYRRARAGEGKAANPTRDLELPAPDSREVEILAPEVAAGLIEALPVDDRAIWATALDAGLRYGELRALRWGAIDLAAGTIKVRESWGLKGGVDCSQDPHLSADDPRSGCPA